MPAFQPTWTTERVEFLKNRFEAGLSCREIAVEIGVSRIMFSADYPYGSMAKARAFLEQIPVSAADRARIAHGNAESLFRL